MKKLFLSLITLISFQLFAQNVLVNDANAEARQIAGSFTAIKVSGGIDIYISQSDAEAVAVSATEQEYRNSIKTEIESGTLKVYYDGSKGWNKGNEWLNC